MIFLKSDFVFCWQIEAEEVSRTNEFVQLQFHGEELDDKVEGNQGILYPQEEPCS